jgi:hypothetical protein
MTPTVALSPIRILLACCYAGGMCYANLAPERDPVPATRACSRATAVATRSAGVLPPNHEGNQHGTVSIPGMPHPALNAPSWGDLAYAPDVIWLTTAPIRLHGSGNRRLHQWDFEAREPVIL